MRIISAEKRESQSVSQETAKKTRNASPHHVVRDLEKMANDKPADELALAAQVETKLRAIYPCEVVRVEEGVFIVDVEAPLLHEDRLVEEYNAAAKEIPGVKGVRVHLLPSNIWGLG
jgi:hypothetical protein